MRKLVDPAGAKLILESGELLAYPTDTVWGLGGLPTKQNLKKINDLKNRTNKSGLIIISDQIDKFPILVKNHSDLETISLLDSECDYPTSFLAEISADYSYLSSNQKIALRLVKSPAILIKLLAILDTPIISTSLNISGMPVARTMDEIAFDIAILEYDKPLTGKPSRLVDLATHEIFRS